MPQQQDKEINMSNQFSSLRKFIIKIDRLTSNYFWEVIDRLAFKDYTIAKIYEKSIGKEYMRERELFNISENSNILHIGCGSYPLSEIVLSSVKGVRITGVDKDKKAVSLATKIIRKKKLENVVTIANGNGLSYPINKFDVIIVSSCSIPRHEIFNNIFTNAKPNSTIIIREFDSAAPGVISFINKYKNVEMVSRLHHKAISLLIPIFWSSFQFKKN